MASLLYFGADERIPKMLTQIFQERLKESGDASSVMQVKDEKQLNEALIAMAFDTIFCEQSILPGTPNDWLSSSKKTKPSMKCPLVLVGVETELPKIYKFLEGGWTDYFMLPPDKPLLIEKISIYTSGKRNKDNRQVYSMKMSQGGDIAKPAIIEELSEFDCQIRTSQAVPMNELVVLYSKAFGAEGVETATSVIGRCYLSEKHPSFEGQFRNMFYFLGVNTESLTHIRNSLRKQFVAGKNKG